MAAGLIFKQGKAQARGEELGAGEQPMIYSHKIVGLSLTCYFSGASYRIRVVGASYVYFTQYRGTTN
jgi:hypothetical protein